MIPRTRYAHVGEADLAFTVMGDGPRDIVFCAASISHLDAFWELPEHIDVVESLARLGRPVLFDEQAP